MNVYWDSLIGRYRDEKTGRFVSWANVKSMVSQSLNISTNVADTLSGWVANGQISVNVWEQMMREEIKQEYIRQYLASVGGRQAMLAADWGRIGGMLAEQYSHIGNFAAEIALGNLTEAQITARAEMYINSSREGFFKGREGVAVKLGCDEELWIVNASYENCEDCLYFASLGWQPIDADAFRGAYPGSGDTVCLTNCQCGKIFRNTETDEEYGEW